MIDSVVASNSSANLSYHSTIAIFNSDDVQRVSFRDVTGDNPHRIVKYIDATYKSRPKNKGRLRVLA